MSEAERLIALRSLYLSWFAQSGSEYHMEMAAYCTQRIALTTGE